MLGLHAAKKALLRSTAVAAIALGAGGCSIMPDMSSVPDWVDPTTWFGDDSSAQAAGDNGQTPDLAGLPDKPAASTPDEQKQTAQSLETDRSHAKYSADTLRGGTEAAAAPPPDVAPAKVAGAEEMVSSSPSGAAKNNRAAKSAPKPEPIRTAQDDRSFAQEPTGSTTPGTLPSPGSAPVMSVASAEEPPPAASTPPGAQFAVPPAPPAAPPAPAVVPQRTASIAPPDAALGFQPSSAPPLDPSVSQFVAPQIIRHYQETAARAGISSTAPAVVAASPSAKQRRRGASRGEGGPDAMTGAVVANLDAIQPGAAATQNAYANAAGVPAAAVVFFPGDSVALNAEARAKVHAAVAQFKAHGGQGFVRVVGHSSSRTPDMPVERHLDVIFRKSQARADAVAQEIIREGVPADKVLVEAVGDSQPVYYESMPKGEDGNRRAEIFLQG
jgi:outer membrane protein OmpA-like peptidoglycan-associated protein